MNNGVAARRAFLRFLAASPLMARTWAQERLNISSASLDDVLNVMDLEPLAHNAIPPAHWGYFAGGVDDDLTLRMNREAFQHYQLRARSLVDVSTADLRTEIFGSTWDMPIYLSALGSPESVSSRRGIGHGARGQGQECCSDAFYRKLHVGRRCCQGIRHATLVSVLYAGHLGRVREAGATSGGRGLSGVGLDDRFTRRAERGDNGAPRANGHA